MKKLLLLLLMMAAPAFAQFSPGQVLTAAELNIALSAPTIIGGSIDGSPVGLKNPQAGKFTSLAASAPITQTAASYAVLSSDTSIISNYAGTLTLTLPAANSFAGRLVFVRTIQAQAVVSIESNVVPLVGGSVGTAVLAATAGKWALLQSDGSAWQIMAGN